MFLHVLQVPKDYFDKLTPGIQQWWAIKADNFDAVIMFKVSMSSVTTGMVCRDMPEGIAESIMHLNHVSTCEHGWQVKQLVGNV